MTEEIRKKLKELPKEPGIYKMLDKDGTIIYIGKSKCLKNRVKSYFVPSPKWDKAVRMAPFITDLEYETTDTHLEAMLLECELIKTLKPCFNVMMKNDQRYVYLKLESKPNRKPLTIQYEREDLVFGPFRRKGRLEETITILTHFYPIQKAGRSFAFEHHFFPVKMDAAAYESNYQALWSIFTSSDKTALFLKLAAKKMKQAARDYHFEVAAAYKELWIQMESLTRYLHAYTDWMDRQIVADLELPNDHKLFYIAHGYVIHKEIVPAITQAYKDAFIQTSQEKLKTTTLPISDKGMIDYRDIIYSELSEENTEYIR